MKKEKILIDTDMGNDDVMAISILLLSPLVQIGGISVVNGVANSKEGLNNLSRILSYCDENIPIIQGAKRALVEKNAQFPKRDRQRAEQLALLSSLQIPRKRYRSINSSEAIEEFIFRKACEERLTILALGPLTNIAKVIKKYGDSFKRKIRKIVMMGGSITKGNVPPLRLAEYNIWIDPEAAQTVFTSGIPVTMVGIDATDFVPATIAFKEKVRKIKPKDAQAKIIKEIIVNNDSDFDAFYDPLAALVLLDPSIVTKKLDCAIDIVLSGTGRGQTFAINTRPKNVAVILKLESNKFYKVILDLLTKYETN